MKIAFPEIWNFISLVNTRDRTLRYSLHAGQVRIKRISTKTILNLREDMHYDSELLPSLFTFRDILWQPNLLEEAERSLPSLRILKAFCDDTVDELEQGESGTQHIYARMIKGVSQSTEKAINELEYKNFEVKHVLRELRISAFPIIKFFISHPMNREDFFNDAYNRLNFMVKTNLTEFDIDYSFLEGPYWTVHKKKTKKSEPKLTSDSSEQ